MAAERTRPQPDCCEGFRQAVPGGRGSKAGGAACPPCTGRRGALSQLCGFHIATYSPATQASRWAEGGDRGERGSQEAAPIVPGLPQLRAGKRPVHPANGY